MILEDDIDRYWYIGNTTIHAHGLIIIPPIRIPMDIAILSLKSWWTFDFQTHPNHSSMIIHHSKYGYYIYLKVISKSRYHFNTRIFFYIFFFKIYLVFSGINKKHPIYFKIPRFSLYVQAKKTRSRMSLMSRKSQAAEETSAVSGTGHRTRSKRDVQIICLSPSLIYYVYKELWV